MATYRSYEELEVKQLKYGDLVEFLIKETLLTYKVNTRFLQTLDCSRNDIIFSVLNLDKRKLVEDIYHISPVYYPCGGWPECKEGDYEALTRLVLVLFKKCEEFNTNQNTSKEPMKKKSVKKSLYKVGDKVIVKDQYDPGCTEEDYPCTFLKDMMKEYGGKVVTISKVLSTVGDYKDRKLYIEDYKYEIEEETSIWVRAWSAAMFKGKAEEVEVEKDKKEETLATVDPLSSFKEGDLVKIIDNDHPNMSVALRPYAGQWFKVEDTLSYTLRINSCKDGQTIYITPDLIAVHYRKNSFNTSLSDFDSTVEELSRKHLESLKKETVEEIEEETIQEKPFTIPLSYEEVKLSLKKPICKF